MSNETISVIRTSSLQEISPFTVSYETATILQKLTKDGRKYSVVEVVVSPVGLETDTKYKVDFFTNEYKSIVALGFDIDGVQATPTLNQKTGNVTNIYQKWSKK